MNYNNFIIEAALDLGIIQKTDAQGHIPYSLDLEGGAIGYYDQQVEITDQMRSRAVYLAKLAEIRNIRDALIVQSDWMFLSDSNVSGSEKDIWQQYRQQLRDCTDNLVEGRENEFIFPSFPTT